MNFAFQGPAAANDNAVHGIPWFLTFAGRECLLAAGAVAGEFLHMALGQVAAQRLHQPVLAPGGFLFAWEAFLLLVGGVLSRPPWFTSLGHVSSLHVRLTLRHVGPPPRTRQAAP